VSSCREGLPERPRKRRNNSSQSNGNPSKSSNSRRVEVTDKKVQAKKALDRSSKKLEQLESLHERSNGSLQLSETGRLRLSSDSFQRKSRILPSFDLKLTDLTGSPLPDSGSNEDEDELPEPLCLVKNYKDLDDKRALSISPATRYSDPELDTLIRNSPLENRAQGLQNMSPLHPASDRVVDLSNESPGTSMRTSLLKRPATTIGEAPVAKRSRYSPISGDVDDNILTESSGTKNYTSPSMPSKIFYEQNTSSAEQQDDSSEPLFLSSPSEDMHTKVSETLYEPGFYEGDTDFDFFYFDVLPVPETWSSQVDEFEKPSEIASYNPQPSLPDETSYVSLPREQISDCLQASHLGDTETVGGDTELDPYADFEAWLLQEVVE
jgi:hypothetical protein